MVKINGKNGSVEIEWGLKDGGGEMLADAICVVSSIYNSMSKMKDAKEAELVRRIFKDSCEEGIPFIEDEQEKSSAVGKVFAKIAIEKLDELFDDDKEEPEPESNFEKMVQEVFFND